MRGQEGFEAMERDNERQPMVSHQSIQTPESVAMDCKAVYEMKDDAMDEAYGMSGKRGCERDHAEIKRQFRDYDWA